MAQTRRTFKTTDDRGCQFSVTRYCERKATGEVIEQIYIANVAGTQLRAKTLCEIKALAGCQRAETAEEIRRLFADNPDAGADAVAMMWEN